jgi:hypothetical protein
MEFFIKQNATLPALKLQIVNNGRYDFDKLMNLFQVSNIYFYLIDANTGIKIVANSKADIISNVPYEGADTEYFVYYKFNSRTTKKPGRYIAQFSINSNQGDLILPIKDKLYINIVESIISIDNCCKKPPTSPTPTPDIIDAIITDDVELIMVDIGVYLKYIDPF